MGNRIFDKDKMQEILRTQQRHINCIQDPPGVQLYRKMGQVTKGGGHSAPVSLCTWLNILGVPLSSPKPLCARTSASGLHFQMHLMCDVRLLLQKGYLLSPGQSTGELTGVEFLYSQTNKVFEEDFAADAHTSDGIQDEDLNSDLESDEGFEDVDLDELMRNEPPTHPDEPGVQSHLAESSLPKPMEDKPPQSQMENLGPDGRPGYDHIVRLANSLVDLRHEGFVTQQKVDEIVTLWYKLSEFDKGALIYPARHHDRLVKGRFKVSHSVMNVTPEADSLQTWTCCSTAGQPPPVQVSFVVLDPAHLLQATDTAVIAVPAATPPGPKVPRTTTWRQRKAVEAAAAQERCFNFSCSIRKSSNYFCCSKDKFDCKLVAPATDSILVFKKPLTGSVTKGGLTLPVYRCAQGSTSMESFHNHLNGFMPGKITHIHLEEHFQAYLLEGLEQWNEDRAATAVTHDAPLSLRCYSGSLQHSLNELSQCLLGCSLAQSYSKPGQYTGELIGVEYLCSQQSWEFRENFGWDPDVPEGIPADLGDIDDEGFGDEAEKQDNTISPLSLVSTKEAICLSRNSPSPSQSSQDLPPEPQEDVCRGPEGAPGFDRVVDLARYLVELREKPCIPDREAAEIVRLFKATHFKTSTCHGKESLKQCVLGQGSGPAQWPNISRTVEAVCLELCFIHPAGKVKWGVSMNCWAAIIHDYHKKTGGELPSTERTNKNPAF
ncbi:hypothetical protein QQF64_031686 [Cirrhinus molitorella]|uniref:Uncharacterized protein n=1 Tax=Cirrhinus molitorella TaxID=172907 RepID=A0ABR3MXR5_9TELE